MRNNIMVHIFFLGVLSCAWLYPSILHAQGKQVSPQQDELVEKLESMIQAIDQKLTDLPNPVVEEGEINTMKVNETDIDIKMTVKETGPVKASHVNKGFVVQNPSIGEDPVSLNKKNTDNIHSSKSFSENDDTQDIAVKNDDVMTPFDKKVERFKLNFKPDEDIYKGTQEIIETEPVKVLASNLVIDETFKKAKHVKDPVLENHNDSKFQTTTVTSNEMILASIIKKGDSENRMDLDFDNALISDIFRTLGEAGNLNIVLDPELRGNTLDLHLKDVPIEDAMILLADSYNLGFKKVGNSLFVTTKERIRNDNITQKVVKLRHISSQAVKDATDDFGGTINAHELGNSIVLFGTPQEIANVENIIHEMDVARPQVKLEAQIVEVNKDALKDLGVDWSDEIRLDFQETSRPNEFDTTESASGSPFRVSQFARTPIQFSTVINMLESENKAKILANPSIITLNNEESEIFVGDRIPYTITTVTGGVATTEVRFEEPGIRLKITPSIVEDDFVVIKIEPEVSFIFAFRGPNNEYPQTKSRRATAHVRVKNNQSFILGGLLNQEERKNINKVPLLGDVPMLGSLFRYENHTVIDSELIISVTPKVISGEII